MKYVWTQQQQRQQRRWRRRQQAVVLAAAATAANSLPPSWGNHTNTISRFSARCCTESIRSMIRRRQQLNLHLHCILAECDVFAFDVHNVYYPCTMHTHYSRIHVPSCHAYCSHCSPNNVCVWEFAAQILHCTAHIHICVYHVPGTHCRGRGYRNEHRMAKNGTKSIVPCHIERTIWRAIVREHHIVSVNFKLDLLKTIIVFISIFISVAHSLFACYTSRPIIQAFETNEQRREHIVWQ